MLQPFLPEDDPTQVPDDPELRSVYLWLKRRANPQNGVVSGTQVINDLSQNKGMKAPHIKARFLEPLRNDGWIVAKRGRIYIPAVRDDGGDAS